MKIYHLSSTVPPTLSVWLSSRSALDLSVRNSESKQSTALLTSAAALSVWQSLVVPLLFYSFPPLILLSVAFSILSNLCFIHSSQTDACYPPVVVSSSLINGVLNHSAVLSLSFMSPQFFILLLLIFFLEILSIMLFFIYQDEVRHLDSSQCMIFPVIFHNRRW